jgi:hypothetical protein
MLTDPYFIAVFQKEIQMGRIWSYALLLALTGCVTTGDGGASYSAKDWLVDARRPHGQARSQAVKLADGQTCNKRAMSLFPHDQAAFDNLLYKCLSDHGWRVVRTERAPAQSEGSGGIDPITQAGIDAGTQQLTEQSNAETSAAGAAAA